MLHIKQARYRIHLYHESGHFSIFEEWLEALDKTIRLRINARIARFEDGHFGDSKTIGHGLYEARFFIGPGYRIYFAIIEDRIILILAAGDKSSQRKDILKAKNFLKKYLKEVNNANKKS